MNRNYWPSSYSRRTHFPRLTQCEHIFTRERQSIDPLLCDMLCLSCHLSFYSYYDNYLTDLFFVLLAMGIFRRRTMLKEKRQVSVIMRLLRQELRKATAGLKQTSPARSPSRPRTMRHIALCNILASLSLSLSLSLYIYIYIYIYIHIYTYI